MRKPAVCFFLLLLTGAILYGQEDKFKALFIYNFIKNLEWPPDLQKGDFVIGVMGASPIIQELSIIAEKRMVGSQSIVVRRINESDPDINCNILFVPEIRSAKIEEIAQKAKKRGILLITDKDGLAKSHSGINFVKINGKQNFEVNRKHIEERGIKVNTALLTLGIEVK